MRFIYDLLSAIIIVMSVTGLLVDQIKKYQYIVLLVYIMVMVELSSITGLGQIVGLVMAPVLFLILAFFIKNRKIWNLCLGCVGYLLNITFNNLVIYVVSQIGKVSALTMSEKYWLQFSVGYVVLLGIVLYIIRECLIRKRDKAIEETSGMITRGLFINLILFMIVFIIKKICFQYDESHIILKDVDLYIPEGNKIAIIGDNGSGKTTLMNLLLGIMLPDTGEICMGDKSILEIGLNEWRNQFAVVGQKPYLFQGTVKNNIDLYNEKDDVEIERLAKKLGIELNIEHHRKGYSYMVQDNGINLSGGEKQKIAFLRAFIKKSSIIILDEMFSNCDEESRRKIRKIVFDPELRETVILISHYKEDISEVDAVYELKNGVLSKK